MIAVSIVAMVGLDGIGNRYRDVFLLRWDIVSTQRTLCLLSKSQYPKDLKMVFIHFLFCHVDLALRHCVASPPIDMGGRGDVMPGEPSLQARFRPGRI